MKLLSISTDRTIFEEASAVRQRMAAYSQGLEELDIIVFKKGKAKHANIIGKLDGRGGDASQSDEIPIALNCWAYSTRSRSKLAYPFDAIRLGRFLVEKRGLDHITVQDASLTAMAGVSLKKQFGLPLEIQVHEDIGARQYPFNITNKVRKALALSYLPKADSIRVVSERIKKYLVDIVGIDENKITIRPIPVDVAAIKSAPVDPRFDLHKKYPHFTKIILMASRLEKEKNIGLALRAFKEVLQKIPGAGLVIVGQGSQGSKLKKTAKKLGLNTEAATLSYSNARTYLNASAIFEGWADRAALVSYYKTADLFLNTSLFEGYGMALVEAQAAGCPIVSTDVGVAREAGARLTGWDAGGAAHAIIEALL